MFRSTMHTLSDNTEQWKPVVGFEKWYEISSLGQIKAKQTRRKWKAGREIRARQRNKGKYFVIDLYGDSGRRTRYVHRLVAATFIGPCPEGKEVNHKDGDKANNRRSNLEYVTRATNIQHALASGLLRRVGGSFARPLTDGKR